MGNITMAQGMFFMACAYAGLQDWEQSLVAVEDDPEEEGGESMAIVLTGTISKDGNIYNDVEIIRYSEVTALIAPYSSEMEQEWVCRTMLEERVRRLVHSLQFQAAEAGHALTH